MVAFGFHKMFRTSAGFFSGFHTKRLPTIDTVIFNMLVIKCLCKTGSQCKISFADFQPFSGPSLWSHLPWWHLGTSGRPTSHEILLPQPPLFPKFASAFVHHMSLCHRKNSGHYPFVNLPSPLFRPGEQLRRQRSRPAQALPSPRVHIWKPARLDASCLKRGKV